ncbi:hypothetical protein [Streptomyces sp. NPDC002346]
MHVDDVERHHAEAEPAGDTAGGQPGAFQGLVQARIDRLQVVAQPAFDAGRAHSAAGALEQRGADAPFLFSDDLADRV